MINKKNIGSKLDDFLEKEGILKECEQNAISQLTEKPSFNLNDWLRAFYHKNIKND